MVGLWKTLLALISLRLCALVSTTLDEFYPDCKSNTCPWLFDVTIMSMGVAAYDLCGFREAFPEGVIFVGVRLLCWHCAVETWVQRFLIHLTVVSFVFILYYRQKELVRMTIKFYFYVIFIASWKRLFQSFYTLTVVLFCREIQVWNELKFLQNYKTQFWDTSASHCLPYYLKNRLSIFIGWNLRRPKTFGIVLKCFG